MPVDAAASSPSVPDLRQRIEKLEAELRARTAGLDEALRREAAVASVLQVINISTGNLTPVFDVMLEKATALCEADAGVFALRRGDGRFDWAAMHGFTSMPEFAREPVTPHPESGVGRLVSGETIVHILDSATGPTFESRDAGRRAIVELGGARTPICVALRKNSALLGAFVIWRREVRPFAESQIALLQNFATQAVIAMENARLLAEQREALEQQTATVEVLEVINSSPGDLAPVFNAMLDKALRSCGAAFGILWTFDGKFAHAAALRGATAECAQFLTSTPHRPGINNAHGRLLSGEEFVHIADIAAERAYHSEDPVRRATIELGGARTLLAVALRKESTVLGFLVIYRRDVRLFAEKQISLLQNFATQAVIAMENARLLGELRQRTDDLSESLERQTATTEVLETINSSPGDPLPVFGAILTKAMTLCDAAFGTFATFDGKRLRTVAARGVPETFDQFRQSDPPDYGPGTGPAQLIAGEDIVHDIDVADSDAYRQGDPSRQAIVELGGARTVLNVVLRKDNSLLGGMSIYRQEVRPFSDNQIELLQGFAAQAVIAMENARLLSELAKGGRCATNAGRSIEGLGDWRRPAHQECGLPREGSGDYGGQRRRGRQPAHHKGVVVYDGRHDGANLRKWKRACDL